MRGASTPRFVWDSNWVGVRIIGDAAVHASTSSVTAGRLPRRLHPLAYFNPCLIYWSDHWAYSNRYVSSARLRMPDCLMCLEHGLQHPHRYAVNTHKLKGLCACEGSQAG
jgi:hypothetical protein